MVANEPDLGAESWLQVREAAADELASGHRAARAIEFIGDLDDRARFLELRESFIRDWQPRTGIETALIDAMTQAFSLYERWLARSAGRMEVVNVREDRQGRVRGWSPPMQMEADALHQAAEMADRFNRIFLRNLRALRDLRRYAGSVVVQNAGQVNVGGQQVNLSGG